MKQSRHDAADVERAGERSEREVAPSERIRLLAARRLVVIVERRRDGGGIEPVQCRERLRGVGFLDAAIVRKLDELFLRGRDVENLLVEDREAGAALRHHVRRVAGISGALVAEAMARCR